MYKQVEKSKENKNQSVANEVSQKQGGGVSTFQFEDNRPEAAAQRKLKEIADNSQQVKQAAQFRKMSNEYPAQRQAPIHKKENNTDLSASLKSGIENLSGYAMDDVTVHYNSDKPAQLQAHALIIQRVLNSYQKEQLKKAQLQFARDHENYLQNKAMIAKIEQQLIIHEKKDRLKEFQAKIKDSFEKYDKFFSETEEYGRRAHLSGKTFEAFVTKVNRYNQSGGKNKFLNLIRMSKALSKSLPKQNLKEDNIPSVLLLDQYKKLLNKVYRNITFLVAQKAETVSDLGPIDDLLKKLTGKVDVFDVKDNNMAGAWAEIVVLHREVRDVITSKKDLHKDGFNDFLTIRLVDKKSPQINSLFKKELQEVGVLNVASRSNKSEGKYMRSQYDHEGNESKQGEHRNPFGDRMKPFLENDAKDYNVGGSTMITDQMMEQKKLRPKRRSNSPVAFNSLRDDIIKHKNEQVAYIVNNLKGHKKNLFLPVKQLDAKYPCVLILFSENLLKQVESSQTNIPEFLTHFLIGHANAALVAAGLRPLIERRQSFGFMTPTMTDVHSGVRLSLGITPSKKWSDAVIQGLKSADKNIGNINGYENLGEKDKATPDHLTMNKFNRGSVLGAGHKLITKLLEKETDIKPADINKIFGRTDGDDVVKNIGSFKPAEKFDKQVVSNEAKKLLNRLKSFYEHYIAITSGKDVKKNIDWDTVDPALELQKLMDESLKATYQGGKDVAGLDETSDEEDEAVNRTPSGMSALAVPLVAYREAQSKKYEAVKKGEKSVVYDVVPFSYFEIDGSWKGTFNVDYIERLGARYPLYKNKLKAEVEQLFENYTTTQLTELKEKRKAELEKLEESKNDKLWKITADKKEKLKETNKIFVQKEEKKVQEYFEKNRIEDRGLDDEQVQKESIREQTDKIKSRVLNEQCEEEAKIKQTARNDTTVVKDWYKKKKEEHEKKAAGEKEAIEKVIKNLNLQLRKELYELFNVLDQYMAGGKKDQLSPPALKEEKIIKSFEEKATGTDLESRLYSIILDTFNKGGLNQMQKAKQTEKDERVEVAFVDVNPCMTSESGFDSGANLYFAALKKYKGLKMIVLDTTSSTKKQVNELVDMFQKQKAPAVPFLCLAKSSTKHDQMGLDISTMGRTQYIMNKQYKVNTLIKGEYANLQSASRKLAQNTEPLMVKKMRRDMKKAASAIEKK